MDHVRTALGIVRRCEAENKEVRIRKDGETWRVECYEKIPGYDKGIGRRVNLSLVPGLEHAFDAPEPCPNCQDFAPPFRCGTCGRTIGFPGVPESAPGPAPVDTQAALNALHGEAAAEGVVFPELRAIATHPDLSSRAEALHLQTIRMVAKHGKEGDRLRHYAERALAILSEPSPRLKRIGGVLTIDLGVGPITAQVFDREQDAIKDPIGAEIDGMRSALQGLLDMRSELPPEEWIGVVKETLGGISVTIDAMRPKTIDLDRD